MEKSIAHLEVIISYLEEQLNTLKEGNQSLSTENEDCKFQIETLEEKIRKLEKDIQELEESVDYQTMEALEAQLEDSEKLILIAKDFFDNHAMAFENQKLVYLKLDFIQRIAHYEIQHNFIVQ